MKIINLIGKIIFFRLIKPPFLTDKERWAIFPTLQNWFQISGTKAAPLLELRTSITFHSTNGETDVRISQLADFL
jgi:hypothetical protein